MNAPVTADLAPNTQRQGSWSMNMNYRTSAAPTSQAAFPAPPTAWAGPSGSKLMRLHNMLGSPTVRLVLLLSFVGGVGQILAGLLEWALS
jgi:hypothetical protein